ncbi:MAG: MFS transporter [Candidatus Paceibacterota bacterium]
MQRLMFKAWNKVHEGNFFVLTYTATLLLSFHYYFIIYVSSSYLNQYISSRNVGIVFAAGAIVNIAMFISISKYLKRFGNRKVMLFFITLECVLLISLGFLHSISWIVPLFIIHEAINPMLLLSLDIFLSDHSKNESIGAIRGIFMSIIGVSAVTAPIIAGSLLGENNFSNIFFVSAFFVIVLFILVLFNFKKYKDNSYQIIQPLTIIEKFIKSKPIREIFTSNLMLQLFYSWMIIYIPIYLFKYIGFSWSEIGLIISISIIPFVLFEFPLGELADKKIGEKEILLTGFAIMIVGLVCISLFHNQDILVWAFLLTFTRTGASFVEVASETYFFKHINDTNKELVNFWRTANPLGFIMGTVLASIALITLSYQYIFFILAGVLLLGFLYATRIKDTL